jgi:hypothetical protein
MSVAPFTGAMNSGHFASSAGFVAAVPGAAGYSFASTH